MLLTDAVRSTGAILANTAKGSRRARFTVAHELGHFLMERHVLSNPSGFRCIADDMRETQEGRRDLRQETQANQFAIGLLAPGYLVNPLLSPDPDLRDAQRLSALLDISLEACVRHLLEIRPEPLAAVWSYKGRIRYFGKSSAFPFVTCKAKLLLPQTSAACRAVSNGTPGYTEVQATHATAWTSQPDLDLYEQTRVSKTGHAVTLFWADTINEDDSTDDGHPELDMPKFR
ncbi:ImmA/IrrE family metallo-endopeptidase [Loktanella sp. DJP18]|uniref:ImmA/IrrE family metallo-endopeptidase n=1 Tax=Loktanella sp. DJP18 TaxID=3409788 RepID=UPI003BB54F5D